MVHQNKKTREVNAAKFHTMIGSVIVDAERYQCPVQTTLILLILPEPLTDLGHCSRFVRIHREYKLSRMYQKIRCADYGQSEIASQSGPSSTPMGDISSTDSVKQKNPEMRARMFATARSNPKTQWYGRLDIGDKTQQRKTTERKFH